MSHYIYFEGDKELNDILNQSLSGTPYDVAKLAYHIFENNYVYCNNKWWAFLDHQWKEIHGIPIVKLIEFYHKHLNRNPQISKILEKLNTLAFRDKLVKELWEFCWEKDFSKKLDTNTHLIGFNNGVYDLRTFEFRSGNRNDYISFTTGYDYDPNIDATELKEFLKPLFVMPDNQIEFAKWLHGPDNHMKNILDVMSGALSGEMDNRLHALIGDGANGKSKFLELAARAFGEYHVVCSNSPLKNSNPHELMVLKNKRLCIFQELEHNDKKINFSWYRDPIEAKPLFNPTIVFKPTFKMFIASNTPFYRDEILHYNFTSHFVSNPTKKHEYKAENNLDDKIKRMAPAFMNLLIERYKKAHQKEQRIIETDLTFPPQIQQKGIIELDVTFPPPTNMRPIEESQWFNWLSWFGCFI